MSFRSLEGLEPGVLRLLNQQLIPAQKTYIDCTDYQAVAAVIREMVVRGAPAIGDAAAYGMALAARASTAATPETVRTELAVADGVLRTSRPTAVNLFWALDRVAGVINDSAHATVEALKAAVLSEAHAIAADDARVCKQIGLNGLELVPDQATIIHHCNTGSLATQDYGTALGIIRTAHEHGKRVYVLVEETRPRLQGARLTAWELHEQGIPYQIIVDGASGHFMRLHGVDLCVVGADRIAANGDTANKVGTYNLAIVAHAHGMPFYVAAPLSTIDLDTPSGDEIEIEERPSVEITHIEGVPVVPQAAPAGNPAFDVTPAKYITAIITEKGIVYPPYTKTLRQLFNAAETS
ncbi:MAG: S-methyl-5-thioribose-1-phosphate isomerase [bacterium]|nr:S-methyl-5-thioribose-1-phosphate isomerase [bacterium]